MDNVDRLKEYDKRYGFEFDEGIVVNRKQIIPSYQSMDELDILLALY